MKKVFLIKHSRGALGLRVFGFGPNFWPNKGLTKLQHFFNKNAFWAKGRSINDLKNVLLTVIIISIWFDNKIVGFAELY